jgi:hypothetical protein
VSSRRPSGSRSWRSPPSTLPRVPPMEVEWFKHRQLAPTVGPSSRSSGEFEGPISDQSTQRMVAVFGNSTSSYQLGYSVSGCKHKSSKIKSRAQINNRNSPTPAGLHHAIATSGSSCLARIRLAEDSGTVTTSNGT